eukprot:TRINITY_DN229_c1_g1_i1.p1 TRINITY_DN229_c1_g1~~TRINITY_DN229_c1_g1_i1.p1  ORF type:complete len:162 (+),score=26.35 TRINITY_DN229_c1_g1_i1:507-992(+)
MFYAEQTNSHFNKYKLRWEYDGTNTPTPFQSIPDTFWWCFVTIATVGYGDKFPTSDAGKVVACLTMFLALISLSLPIVLIGNSFVDVINESERKKRKKENKMFKESGQPSLLLTKQIRDLTSDVEKLDSTLREMEYILENYMAEHAKKKKKARKADDNKIY